MATSNTTYASDDTVIWGDIRTAMSCNGIQPIAKKRIGNKRIDRIIQKAEAAQRFQKTGRWK